MAYKYSAKHSGKQYKQVGNVNILVKTSVTNIVDTHLSSSDVQVILMLKTYIGIL